MRFTLRKIDTIKAVLYIINKQTCCSKVKIQFISLVFIEKMSRTLDTVVFVTFCYVLKKLDV